MANRDIYINPNSPSASNSNTGADNSVNALLSFAGVQASSSLNIYVEAGCTLEVSSVSAGPLLSADRLSEIRIRKNAFRIRVTRTQNSSALIHH